MRLSLKKFILLLIISFSFLLVSCQNKKFKVNFDLDGGTLISGSLEQIVESSEELEAPICEKEGFVLTGWSEDLATITKKTTVKALWDDVEKYAIVSFMIDEDKVFTTETVKKGSPASDPGVPTREGYIFKGWDQEFNNITNDTIVTAKWRLDGTVNVNLNTGDYTFSSKQELFYSFFKDYYEFIVNNYGYLKLQQNKIYSLADFYNLASSFTWNQYTNMTAIGHVAGQYFLVKDIGGKIEDQPTTHFIGYCYQNNMYVDFILFQIDFFAWWREDEGYTTPTNNGSDFFAESWAPMVDLGKFFYYDEYTSYVQSARVRDCFINIASVVKCDKSVSLNVNDADYVLPQDLTRRGYNFLGWYDAQGNEVVKVENDYLQEDITLYAKWEAQK